MVQYRAGAPAAVGRRVLRRSGRSRPRDPELRHARFERGRRHAEPIGGATHAPNAPAGALEHAADVRFLNVDQSSWSKRRIALSPTAICLSGGTGRPRLFERTRRSARFTILLGSISHFPNQVGHAERERKNSLNANFPALDEALSLSSVVSGRGPVQSLRATGSSGNHAPRALRRTGTRGTPAWRSPRPAVER
jgi:hypothetical protein